MKDSYGTYDGRIAEPPYECPRCAELEAALAALRQHHAAKVEAGYREGWCRADWPSHTPPDADDLKRADAAWLASEAKHGAGGGA